MEKQVDQKSSVDAVVSLTRIGNNNQIKEGVTSSKDNPFNKVDSNFDCQNNEDGCEVFSQYCRIRG
ncbi:hypothetical protein KKC17_01565 [Patescibacteria group bacterium]|nr:hypothetical protein [Patescibacteria group bacterium]